ncbi:MAG: hypothetical protein C0410_07825 [Anaerolinea sp.]|nr:hypothetical protein [Anaerolinea sp.]
MNEKNLLLVGCGILRKEVKLLIAKNRWPVDTIFFDSALHIDFGKLSTCLTSDLKIFRDREVIVFYGCCHPLMDTILDDAKTFRTTGQNCVDMLLGNELFTEELTSGAFFLLEEWAQRWDHIIAETFGDSPKVTREIFQMDRKYLLGIRTPCSSDFKDEAEDAARKVGLPLRWVDVSLDHLESVLQATIARKLEEVQCQRP